MSDHPLEQLDSQVPGSDDPNATVRIRKRDKLREIFRIPKSKSKDIRPMTPNQLTTKRPPSIVSQISNDTPCDNHAVIPAPVIQVVSPQPSPQSLPLNKEQAAMDVFPENLFSVAWNPAVTLEFVTGCGDGSLRVWRIGSHDYNDGGDVSVQMLWGNDVGLLCASNLTLKGAVGLSPLNQKLLLQRGAIGDSTTEGFESSD
ncbi:hypothetical protein EC991_001912 [Linnemannia zychae]|nr:hypothetical protein EC991_001912 [Linnemannia zychae]